MCFSCFVSLSQFIARDLVLVYLISSCHISPFETCFSFQNSLFYLLFSHSSPEKKWLSQVRGAKLIETLGQWPSYLPEQQKHRVCLVRTPSGDEFCRLTLWNNWFCGANECPAATSYYMLFVFPCSDLFWKHIICLTIGLFVRSTDLLMQTTESEHDLEEDPGFWMHFTTSKFGGQLGSLFPI